MKKYLLLGLSGLFISLMSCHPASADGLNNKAKPPADEQKEPAPIVEIDAVASEEDTVSSEEETERSKLLSWVKSLGTRLGELSSELMEKVKDSSILSEKDTSEEAPTPTKSPPIES